MSERDVEALAIERSKKHQLPNHDEQSDLICEQSQAVEELSGDRREG